VARGSGISLEFEGTALDGGRRNKEGNGVDDHYWLPYHVMGEVYRATERWADAVSMAEKAHQVAPAV
jgi:hypothetical protein